MALNRRDFLDASLGAALWTSAASSSAAPAAPKLPKISSTFGGVPLGCGSISFMDSPVERVPELIVDAGYGMTEIIDNHMQPQLGRGPDGPPPGATGGRGGRGMDPETRVKLREWRMNVPLDRFKEMGRLYRAKGVYVYSYHSHFTPDFTDGEIDRIFEMAKAMGCQVMTAATVTTNDFAPRLDRYAKKHRMRVGVHNLDANLATEAQYDALLHGCSDYMGINFDIGHWADAGSDCVELLRRRNSDIVELHIKGKRGTIPPGKIFPDGDTTAKDVLLALRDNKWPIPAMLEFEVRGADRLASCRAWFAYSKQVLLS